MIPVPDQAPCTDCGVIMLTKHLTTCPGCDEYVHPECSVACDGCGQDVCPKCATPNRRDDLLFCGSCMTNLVRA